MRPYGLRKYDELECFGGPPTRERKLKSGNRQTSRRRLHKQGRQDSQKELLSHLKDSRASFRSCE